MLRFMIFLRRQYTFLFLYLEAVCARFRIDHDRVDDFFRTCLRRTLAQMLCEVRRQQRRAGNGGIAGVDAGHEDEVAGDEDGAI